MQFFERIISKEGFSISEAMLVEAKKMDFAKALSVLQTLDKGSRILVLDTLKQLSMSDSVCVPLEAILIFAVEQAFINGTVGHSIPQSGINIENLKVIYIENQDIEASAQI